MVSSGPPTPASLSRTSYWLQVASSEQAGFADLIGRLAERYNGPTFAPHLTIYSGPAAPGDDHALILAAVAAGGKLRLHCTGLAFSENFTRACTLNFAPEERLARLSAAIGANCGRQENFQLLPHLSLFYGKLSPLERQQISELVKIPVTVSFTALAAMATSAGIINSGDQVRSWQQLAWRSL